MTKIYKKIMLKKIKKHLEEYYKNNQYSLCMSELFINNFYKENNFIEINKLLNTCIKIDDKLPVSMKVGKDLEDLINREDIVLGIYRTVFDEKTLRSSKVQGIISYGIPMAKDVSMIPNLTDKIIFPRDIIDLMQNLKDNPQEPRVDFILTFPKELVNENGSFEYDSTKSIYNILIDRIYVKPIFISSYVVSNQGIMNKIDIRDDKKILIKNKKPTN